MAVTINPSVISFLVGLIVSSIVIFIATKLLGEKEGFGNAILSAFIGAVIYALAHYFLGAGTIASILGGIAWVVALGSLYDIGWIKAFVIAVVIWFFASVVSLVLPTLAGPF